MSVAAFVVVLIASGMVALGLLRNRLVNDVDASLNERRLALEQLLQLVPIDQLEGFAADRPQLGGTDLAVIGLAPDGSLVGAAPSGPPDEPDPLPVLDQDDVRRLRAGDRPFTVGGNDGYRVTAVTPEGEQITVVLAQPLDDVALTMRRTLLVLLVVGAGASVILGAAIWYLMRRELRPLDTVAETADRIAGGELSRRVPIQRASNEVGRLGGALNSMLGRIEDAVDARTESEQQKVESAVIVNPPGRRIEHLPAKGPDRHDDHQGHGNGSEPYRLVSAPKVEHRHQESQSGKQLIGGAKQWP